MNITLDNLMKNSYVISINDITLARFNYVFSCAGFKILPKLMHGFKFNQKQFEDDLCMKSIFHNAKNAKFGVIGCGISHACLVKHAYLNDIDYICIFEDDAYPCNKIIEKMPIFLTNIPGDCDILKLGWSRVYKGKIDISKKYSCEAKSWGTFAYIIFKKYYQSYFNQFEKSYISDHTVMNNNAVKIYHTSEQLFTFYNEKYDSTIHSSIRSENNLTQNFSSTYLTEATFINALDKIASQIKKRFEIYNKSAIVIGSNPSITDFNAKDFINNGNQFIIRLNRPAIEKYKCNYGERTDLYFGCEFLKDLLKNVNNKILVSHNDILNISKKYIQQKDKWLTTGFIAILVALKIFDKVEIFGFGYADKKEDDVKYTSICDQLKTSHHLMNYEHELIQQFIDKDYKEKLFRFEDHHNELKCENIK